MSSAWSSQNRESESAVAPITISDPWSTNEKTASEANTGWANFSSPSFANFEANFEPLESDSGSTASTQSVIETDLKVENIENNDKKNIEDNHSAKSSLSNKSIETVAQVVKEVVEEASKEIAAGGDQGNVLPNKAAAQLSK